ncbi:MAG TPA: TonB family protein, partial [Ohtaekwangia sp.]|nr:TonB family protein [Ohtaekwangia sp.]
AYAGVLYGAGTAIALLLLVIRLVRLARLIVTSESREVSGYFLIESPRNTSTFSFFRYIFIGPSRDLTEREREQVIAHEHVHAQAWHSLDVLLLHVLGVIFWFNPLIKVYKKIFVQLHEFEADARAVSTTDADDYCSLVAKVALLSADIPLANHFSNSLTVKRIEMIRTMKTKIKQWKLATLTMVVAAFFIVIACQDQLVDDAKNVARNSTMALNLPDEVQARLDQLKAEHPDKNFIVIEPDENAADKAKDIEEKTRGLDPGKIARIEVLKDKKDRQGNTRSFVILEYNEQTRQLSEQTQSQDMIFTVVEQSAEPAGGIDGLMTFLGENLRYPNEAREKGKEGKVYVQFVVNTDGSLSDHTVLKGVDPFLDSEAIRVTKTLPKWTPGRQSGRAVRQQFVLPINFRLDNASPADGLSIREVRKEMKIDVLTKADGPNRIVEGRILDSDGNPLKGANVVVTGTSTGATTDADGRFRISTPITTGKLAASFVGYDTQFVTF